VGVVVEAVAGWCGAVVLVGKEAVLGGDDGVGVAALIAAAVPGRTKIPACYAQ